MGTNKNKNIKASTMIEKQGFRDQDLYNRAHDAICTWLFGQAKNFAENLVIEKTIEKWFSSITIISSREDIVEWGRAHNISIDQDHSIRNFQEKLDSEHKVWSGNFIVGFIDVFYERIYEWQPTCLAFKLKEPIEYQLTRISHPANETEEKKIEFVEFDDKSMKLHQALNM